MPGRILVVDDVATNRLILKAKLAASYYDVIEADCGQAAFDTARKEQPDVILLDIMMPDMDGYEVCELLKACPETSHIPVVMVTASSAPKERIRGLSVGADDFLVKPINDKALFARVRNLLRVKIMFDELKLRDSTSRELGLSEFLEPGDGAERENDTVMLAPATKGQGDVWRERISRMPNVEVIGTCSEREALNMARLEQPDAIIVHQRLMEDGDSLRLISALRARPETRQAVMIYIVSDGAIETAAKALDLGTSDYVMEPFEPEELIIRLRTQLQRKHYSDQLRSNMRDGLKMAVIDPLTGLYNRRYATQHMQKIVDRAKESGNDFAVMMMDLDRFKLINDTVGHDAGDMVLKEFALRIQENVRGVDLIARMGGEEFLVVMPDAGSMVAKHVSERLRRAVESKPFVTKDGVELNITVSIGVAIASSTNCEPSALIKRADLALYAAKSGGRNLVSFHEAA
ncbi:MAG: PleD family two-component system response regulator [Rhodobacteraceae bacterium]|nr:PleD family two-component system response regulator [Paracoccaceae bacterium]